MSSLLNSPVYSAICIAVVALGCSAVTGCTDDWDPPQQRLIPAVISGNIDAVKSLVADTQHVNINWLPDGNGTTALYSAASSGQFTIAQFLMEHGADPNRAGTDGAVPISTAAYHGDLRMAQLLVAHGADVNLVDRGSGFTPLMDAAMGGHTAVAKYLIEAGARVQTRLANGQSAYDIAVRRHFDKTAAVLKP